MADPHPGPEHVRTVAEAGARLSEVLRLARERDPRRIGARSRYVVVTEEQWEAMTRPRLPVGRWLLRNTPRHTPLEPPERRDPPRPEPRARGRGPAPAPGPDPAS